jgi:hypothetical protein
VQAACGFVNAAALVATHDRSNAVSLIGLTPPRPARLHCLP